LASEERERAVGFGGGEHRAELRAMRTWEQGAWRELASSDRK